MLSDQINICFSILGIYCIHAKIKSVGLWSPCNRFIDLWCFAYKTFFFKSIRVLFPNMNIPLASTLTSQNINTLKVKVMLGISDSHWLDQLLLNPTQRHSSFTIDSLVSELWHAPHALRFLRCLAKALLNIPTHSLDIYAIFLWAVTVWFQSQGAAERVDPHSRLEAHQRQAYGASVVPLVGQTLSLLLLMNTLKCFHKHRTEESGNLLHLWFILHQHLPKPMKRGERKVL